MLNSRYFFTDFFSTILNHGIQTGLFMLLVCQDPHQFCLLDTYTLSQYKSKSPHKNRARHGWSRSNTVYVRQWAKYSKNYIFQYICMYTVASTPAVTGFYAGNQFTVFLVQHKIYKQFKSKLSFQNQKN